MIKIKDKDLVAHLRSIFPVTFLVDLYDPVKRNALYSVFIVTIYNKVLTEEECDSQIVSYTNHGKENLEKYAHYEAAYLNFFCELFSLTDIYLFHGKSDIK